MITDEKEESSTLPVETSENDSTKPTNGKKVVVVTPLSKAEDKQSQDQYSSSEEGVKEKEQKSISTKAKGVGKSFKDLITSAGGKGKGTASPVSQPLAFVGNLEYSRILVPHDGSDMADKALHHAIYLSKISDAEIVIIHVVEHMHNVDSSAVLVISKEREGEKDSQKGFEITVEGEVKRMIEQKIKLCQQAGVKSQVSYKVQTGKPVDEIVKLSEDLNADLIVMASSRTPSLTRRLLGSITRKVIDSVEKPVLVVHK
jgi:nucleotide-binding universal stress UspA family protein